MTRFIISILCLMLVFPSLSEAKGTVKVGDKIPHNLELKDQNGKMRGFSDLTGKKGIVLVFVRSVEWCPYCQKQVIDLDKNSKKFSDWGYNVVSVSYDQVQHMEKFVTKNKPKMTLLSDPASDSIRAFGILNTASAKGTMSYGIPYPGVYIVGKDKKVQAKFFKKGYKDRASVTELLNKIEEMNKPVEPAMTIESMGQDPIPADEQFVEIPQEELPPVLPGVENAIEPLVPDEGMPEAALEVPTPEAPVIEVPAAVEPKTELDVIKNETTAIIIEEPAEIPVKVLESVEDDAVKMMDEEVLNSEEIIEIP